MKQGFRLLTAVTLTGLVALGCGMLTGPDGSERLTIQRFLVTPEIVGVSGGKATLLWSVEGAESVSIDPGIGEVEARGSKQVTLTTTTTYTLTALGGNSTATATVRVMVGKPTASPVPDASPSPSPSPSASPSPTPSAHPSPLPSLSPSPSPTPTAGPNSCGVAASLPGCTVSVELPTSMGVGECVQVTRLSASPTCPVTLGMTRTIGFDITAQSAQALSWRRAAGGRDAVTPASGALLSRGVTSVSTTAVVYDSELAFEVVDGAGHVVLRFTMQHR